ncbi:MAG: hypothetical protein LUH36_09980 [Oscillospiraceae bacterium]|nr:hypothetical protein [Oscillospiraceae bacterium]
MKTIRTVFYTLCFAVLLMVPAFASYVDPSVTTFAIQAVVGVVVVAGAVIGVAWRKAKKKAMNVLHIDENAGKEVEDDLVVFDEAAPAGEASEAATAAEEPAAPVEEASEPAAATETAEAQE